MRMTRYGFTLLIAAALCAVTARATGSGQKPKTEYRTVVPVTPQPQPNAAPPAAPEVRPKGEAKTPAVSKNKGGKASIGRGRTGKGRVKVRTGFQLDADGEFGVHDELYGKIEPEKTVEAQKPAPAPATARPSGTTITAVPQTLTVRKPKVTPSGPRQELLYYRVRTGDTLDGIARRLRASGLDVTTADLLRVNHDRLSGANAIRAGDEIRVPLGQRGSPPRRTESMPLK